MSRKGDLGPREMAVLALVDEGVTHGYALAGLMAADGDVGRIWAVRKALTYRVVERLRQEGLVEDEGVAAGHAAPDRRLLRTTTAGRERVRAWLATPEERIRDFRPTLLYKLELLRRRGEDRRPLLLDQRRLVADRETSTPATGALAEDDAAGLLSELQRSQHVAAVEFLDRLLDGLEADAVAPR